jgi:hypothetical protein
VAEKLAYLRLIKSGFLAWADHPVNKLACPARSAFGRPTTLDRIPDQGDAGTLTFGERSRGGTDDARGVPA